jgi:endonuclease G
MTQKTPLLSILGDTAVMDELRNDNESLEAARSGSGSESLDVLLEANESGVTDGGYTQVEAIILLKGRPALVIQDGLWEEPKSTEIRNRIAPAAAALKSAIPKIGRVEILNFASDFVGTGWMIEEDLLITNRHVASLFGERRGATFAFRTNASGQLLEARIDFRREYQRSAIAQAAIKDIVFIEESGDLRPDMALVRLDKSAPLPEPVELDSASTRFRNNIAVIGYPARDPRNDAFAMDDIFRGVYNVKRLSPGWIIGVRPDGKLVEHDCTTLGGNSGSVVFNLESRKACGLHFSGSYLERNFAVSSLWLKARLAELGRPQITVPCKPTAEVLVDEAEERVVRAPNLSAGRSGYQEDFLGKGGLAIPLPEVDGSLADKTARVKGREDGVLTYTHFSIRMRADRRLPFFTAVNIDGGALFNFPRGADRWSKDDRLEDQTWQIGGELYEGNSLDRGHLVRRLDPAWGQTRAEAKRAEEETFFFTNCSPQHSTLNQRTWLGLEDYILSNATTHDLKVSVFCGPVMNENDRDYRGVKIPEEFWKIAVIVNAFTGRPSATGYILSQANYLGDLEFVFGEFKTYQVPISRIEQKTNLLFGLTDHDPLAHTEARPEREIQGAMDLIL